MDGKEEADCALHSFGGDSALPNTMAKGERSAESHCRQIGLLHRAPSADNAPLKQREVKKNLSVCSKLCYAVGGAPYQITGCAIGFFLQIYLLDVAQLDPSSASLILFIGRAWDAITDPTIGFFISKSKWTRFGRLLPWIICSTPFAVASYLLLWYVPDSNVSEMGKIFWYLIFYCSFQTMQTCFHVPYSALTMFISPDQKERDSATAYRMTVEVLGTVLGTAIQGQIVGQAGAACLQNHRYMVQNGFNTSLPTADVNTTLYNQSTSIDQLKQAYLIAAAVIGGVYILCAIILFAGVREREEPCYKKMQKSYSFFKGLKLVMSYGPYVKLIIGFLFTSLAFMLLEGNFALYCSYTLGFPKDFQNILLVIMLSATLTIPFWQWFLTRFGKKTAVYFGIPSAVPFLILIILVKRNLIVAYVVSFASGVSVAAAFLLPWSMLPDVVDDFKLKNPDSIGHEAIFYSFYVFFTKFASGISLGISTLSLDFAGYQTRGCTQPDAVHLTLKMLVAPAPVFLIVIGVILFKLYPIDEETRMKNRKALEDLRDNGQDSETDLYELGSSV
ncbi:sodium-dependent lysophosphatidylcholine symporter 1-B [Callorhinchus milii]|uniref:MFSD2 lysolipid transporter A, lysophospholipid b n=2 Tax=Callorhinchus milii TaxID=7868 RepID=A0A4W3J409_CALMI|nr:sodium-dependent lysophosphatidylcholine symporter 1-B [Callorhinchus milii]|eukprot:gi/632972019/ref/XP_007902454.1/ PREDICTED: major facilitator superfamily domain-containing protein 2A [Callorhinchus milii]